MTADVWFSLSLMCVCSPHDIKIYDPAVNVTLFSLYSAPASATRGENR